MTTKLRYAIQHCTEMDADFKLSEGDVTGWDNAAAGVSQNSGHNVDSI